MIEVPEKGFGERDVGHEETTKQISAKRYSI